MDESTDESDLPQLILIAKYIVGDTLFEENLTVVLMNESTEREDFFKYFMENHYREQFTDE